MQTLKRLELSADELEAQAVAELPERQVLSLLNPAPAAAALGMANSIPPLVNTTQTNVGPTNTVSATNLNSPGIVTNSDHFQNAPIYISQ